MRKWSFNKYWGNRGIEEALSNSEEVENLRNWGIEELRNWRNWKNKSNWGIEKMKQYKIVEESRNTGIEESRNWGIGGIGRIEELEKNEAP